MKRIAIVGAGKIGHMIADLLGGCGDYQVAVIDKSAEQLQRLNATTPVECLAIDVARRQPGLLSQDRYSGTRDIPADSDVTRRPSNGL